MSQNPGRQRSAEPRIRTTYELEAPTKRFAETASDVSGLSERQIVETALDVLRTLGESGVGNEFTLGGAGESQDREVRIVLMFSPADVVAALKNQQAPGETGP